MAIRFKEINPKVYITMGGHHATVRPKDYNVDGIDLVVVGGEGVFTLREVMKHRKLRQSLDDMPGLAIPGIEIPTGRRLPIMRDLLGVLKDVREGYKWHQS